MIKQQIKSMKNLPTELIQRKMSGSYHYWPWFVKNKHEPLKLKITPKWHHAVCNCDPQLRNHSGKSDEIGKIVLCLLLVTTYWNRLFIFTSFWFNLQHPCLLVQPEPQTWTHTLVSKPEPDWSIDNPTIDKQIVILDLLLGLTSIQILCATHNSYPLELPAFSKLFHTAPKAPGVLVVQKQEPVFHPNCHLQQYLATWRAVQTEATRGIHKI